MHDRANQKVLVIDDDVVLGRAIARVLSVTYEVTVLVDPRAAVEALRGGARFDAILCDVMMPGMTGVDVFEALGGELREQRDRMIFMTGGVLTERAQEFLDALVDPFLLKPVPRVQLEAAVREVVDRGRVGRGVAPVPTPRARSTS